MDYDYKVVDSKGSVTTSTGQAPNRIEMINFLKGKGYTILDLRESGKAPVKDKKTGRIQINLEFGVSEKRLVFFTRQLSSTLKAGLPILRCLNLLKSQSISKNLEKIIDEMISDIQNGKTIYEAMKSHNPPFNDLYLSMIKVGESSGSLPEVMNKLADNLEKQLQLRRKIKSALSYPIFILIFASTLVYLMMTFLLPGFEPVFKTSGLNIQRDYPITDMLLKISRAMQSHWLVWVILGAGVLFYLLYRIVKANPALKLKFDQAKFNIPFLQGFIHMQYFAQIADSMGTLLSSGVNLMESLRLVTKAVSNSYLQKAMLNMCDDIEKGEKMTSSMEKSPLFPNLMVQMLAVGEETGTLDEMYFRVSKYYEEELEAALDSLTSLMEPAMMVFVGIIVFFFVIGVLLPIMGISQAVQNQM